MLNKKINFILSLLILFTIFLSGCGSGSSEDDRKKDMDNLSKLNKYVISQTDTRKGEVKLLDTFPGMSNFNADVILKSNGQMTDDIFGSYLGKWKVDYNYSEKWEEILVNLGPGMGDCIMSSNLIKYSATLTFDLDKVNKDDNTFDTIVSNFKSDIGPLTLTCKIGNTTVDPGVVFNPGATIKGKITSLSSDGAIIEFPGDYMFNSYYFTSDFYRKLDKPIALKIKLANN